MSEPAIAITAQAAKRIRNHDCWVFRDELLRPDSSPPAPQDSGRAGLPAGEVVQVVDRHGGFVAYAFYNPRSHIALRVVSIRQEERVDRRWLAGRLRRAIAKRRTLTGTNARRLVFSEADALPGLIVDQYDRWLVIQIRSAGMERLHQAVLELLQELLQPAGILERSDKEFREEEGLEPVSRVVSGTVPDRIQIDEDGLRFLVDPHRGLKTGFYLDQRPTRRRLRQWVQPGQTVLDAFSYTGSLGIAAASRGARVVCVEQQEPFVALAKENAALNGVADRIDWVAGNAFYWLDAKAKEGASVDWVFLDPPALAKAKGEAAKARRALHHLLTQALALLGPDGRLMLSLCTYHLLGLVEEIVRIAAAEGAGRLQVCEQWLQAEDHPWILQIPPTRYLTSWLVSRDAPSAA